MKIKILHLLEGAENAKGLVVVIDVFRAFSLECYLYSMGAKEIRPVGSIDKALKTAQLWDNSVLIGERAGKKVEGFDFGNSPSAVDPDRINGAVIIHTTSAGTQGIERASLGREEIITGSLLNAARIARYIKKKNPDTVSIVAMGNFGERKTTEDELCAEYIYSLLTDRPMADIDKRIADLRYNGGEHFFDESNQSVFPKEDFYMCAKRDIFPFVIKVNKDDYGFVTEKTDV